MHICRALLRWEGLRHPSRLFRAQNQNLKGRQSIMTNRILLHAHADGNTVQLRTVSARVKSPRRFFITYGELDRLQHGGHIITNDIHCVRFVS